MNAQAPATIAERIIGKRLDDSTVKKVLAEIDPDAEPEDDEGETNWSSEESGLELMANTKSQVIDTVVMFAKGIEDYEQFDGALPRGIGFDWSRARIHETLGAPDVTGPHHDRWKGEGHDLVVEYDETPGSAGAVTTVTVTTE